MTESSTDPVAIDGYDAVAYFKVGQAVPGSSEHEYNWQGANWRFSSASNREAFAGDPEKYAPQYGGQCAFATSLGKKEKGAGNTWSIVDGKLYLNSNKVAHFLWKIIPGRIKKGDQNWPGMSA